MSERWKCEWCGGIDNHYLETPNPFDPKLDPVLGCTKCKAVNAIRRACDVDGCDEIATCGTNTDEGYRWTCHKHWPRKQHDQP